MSLIKEHYPLIVLLGICVSSILLTLLVDKINKSMESLYKFFLTKKRKSK